MRELGQDRRRRRLGVGGRGGGGGAHRRVQAHLRPAHVEDRRRRRRGGGGGELLAALRRALQVELPPLVLLPVLWSLARRRLRLLLLALALLVRVVRVLGAVALVEDALLLELRLRRRLLEAAVPHTHRRRPQLRLERVDHALRALAHRLPFGPSHLLEHLEPEALRVLLERAKFLVHLLRRHVRCGRLRRRHRRRRRRRPLAEELALLPLACRRVGGNASGGSRLDDVLPLLTNETGRLAIGFLLRPPPPPPPRRSSSSLSEPKTPSIASSFVRFLWPPRRSSEA